MILSGELIKKPLLV